MDSAPLSASELRAREFAVKCHGPQLYGGRPYVVHLGAVRRVLHEADWGGDVLVAAWLHDVVEDTPATREDVRHEFGELVASLVWAVTGVGKNREERKADAFAKIRAFGSEVRSAPGLAATLKLGDRIANMEAAALNNPSMLRMYQNEWREFEEALRGLGDTRLWARLRRTAERGWRP
jgi:(p)ppGpp synthase/HD superfamily hydrolase